ncbi:hypothetical protein QCA50_008956 [Cerrena zonata]|uniref:Major facilitator superfamily (MFS) profile domain-containing protein n=1 Tax=Cerrena zonata TaxID=2478898 RepID=A0AAW0GCR5_9APHY
MSEVDDSTLTDRNDHLAVRSLEDVSEPIDPRITPDHRPTSEVLDEGYIHQFNEYVHHEKHAHELSQKPDEGEPLYVEFEKGDPRDPINFTQKRKWLITLTACIFTALSAATASTYNLGWPSMIRDLNCTQFQATLGLGLYCLGFAVVPLVTCLVQ